MGFFRIRDIKEDGTIIRNEPTNFAEDSELSVTEDKINESYINLFCCVVDNKRDFEYSQVHDFSPEDYDSTIIAYRTTEPEQSKFELIPDYLNIQEMGYLTKKFKSFERIT